MSKSFRHQYVIGDLQGCFTAFNRLLKRIDFDPNLDKLWLTGDIVARGEDSLATLRKVKALSDMGVLDTVLGNHDITLIATWLGILPAKAKDKTAAILTAPDCDELLQWLRRQPLLHLIGKRHVLVHAGIPHIWTTESAIAYAKEIETLFAQDPARLAMLIPYLYSKTPENWQNAQGVSRARQIVNYFTRMRLIRADGTLEFGFSAGLHDKDAMPKGYRPWFDYPSTRKHQILFGHWAALLGDVRTAQVQALDGGCVWGGRLIALRLEDNKRFWVHGD